MGARLQGSVEAGPPRQRPLWVRRRRRRREKRARRAYEALLLRAILRESAHGPGCARLLDELDDLFGHAPVRRLQPAGAMAGASVAGELGEDARRGVPGEDRWAWHEAAEAVAGRLR